MLHSQKGQIFCEGEAAMQLLGADLALAFKKGDALALIGDLGAGKTTLARALIRAMAADPAIEVPSPTFTLAQHYATRLPITHYDFYRLSDESELEELGLDDALAQGIALIEWPALALPFLPETTLILEITGQGDKRTITWSTPSVALAARIRRNRLIREFLGKAGYQTADRAFLTGDASARQYELIETHGQPQHILMDAPAQPDGPPVRDGLPYSRIAHLAEDVSAFMGVAQMLSAKDFIAPEILASHAAEGLLLISHLGTETILDAAGKALPERYCASAECLAAMHAEDWQPSMAFKDSESAPLSHTVPPYDERAMLIEADLLLDWYLPAFSTTHPTEDLRSAYHAAWRAVFVHLQTAETSLVLRDFHSPNIIWRASEAGIQRIGLIDFQDALIGPAAYDVASLAQDARVDIAPELEEQIIQTYLAARGPNCDASAFRSAYAIMAAQRAAKILGIFVRLDRRDGKPHYLKHLPRMRRYFAAAIRHEALAPVRGFCADHGLTWDDIAP